MLLDMTSCSTYTGRQPQIPHLKKSVAAKRREGELLTDNDLHKSIEKTKSQIYAIKQQIEQAPDLQEKRRLKRRLKELQYLQLWHLDQLG